MNPTANIQQRRQIRDGFTKMTRMIAFICFGLSLLLFCGCMVGPDYVAPKAPGVSAYTPEPIPEKTISAEGKQQAFEWGAEISPDWWKLFGCTMMDSVIEKAVSSNPNLQSAIARLRQSQMNLKAGYGVFFPQFDGNLDVTRQKFTSARYGGSFASSIFTVYSGTASATYDLDFFGLSRRSVEGLKSQADYQAYESKATYLSLVGQIVNAVIAEASYRAQIEATREIIEEQRRQLVITESQADAGRISIQDVLSLKTQLSATEATLPPMLQELSQIRHQLAILVGEFPADWTPPDIDFEDITLPEKLPVSLPSDLVRQRPDILAAEAQLHSASAAIGVATASMFPSITLTANTGQASTNTGSLFNSSSNFWSIGSGLTMPLFHGGTLWFNRKAAMAAYDASLASYRQTVLSAFAQVADTLTALSHDAMTVRARSDSVESSRKALDLIQSNYQAGRATSVQLLIAQIQYQQARIGYIQAVTRRYQDSAVLFAALGGGWWKRQEASNNQMKNQ